MRKQFIVALMLFAMSVAVVSAHATKHVKEIDSGTTVVVRAADVPVIDLLFINDFSVPVFL